MTAEERGAEMMWIKMSELPKLAVDFAKKLTREVGMCSEVLLTAWTVYAQCVEGLECTDSLYLARPQDRAWFEEQRRQI